MRVTIATYIVEFTKSLLSLREKTRIFIRRDNNITNVSIAHQDAFHAKGIAVNRHVDPA